MANNDREIQMARELGAIHERLGSIEKMVERLIETGERNSDRQERRLVVLEKDMIKFKSKVGVVASLVSGAVAFSGWAILNFPKIVKMFS